MQHDGDLTIWTVPLQTDDRTTPTTSTTNDHSTVPTTVLSTLPYASLFLSRFPSLDILLPFLFSSFFLSSFFFLNLDILLSFYLLRSHCMPIALALRLFPFLSFSSFLLSVCCLSFVIAAR